MIKPLSFFRALSFLLVFALHAQRISFFEIPFGNGACLAVSFFFMLSGYLAGYQNGWRPVDLSVVSICQYVWKKIAKFYPLLVLTTLFAVSYSKIGAYIVLGDNMALRNGIVALLRNLLLLQSWFSDFLTYNGVTWFLSTIIFLYIIKQPALFVLVNFRRTGRLLSILLLALFCGVLLSLSCAWCLWVDRNGMPIGYWAYAFPPARVPEYLIGMCCGLVMSTIRAEVSAGSRWLLTWTCAEVASLAMWLLSIYYPGETWTSRSLRWILPNVMILSVFTVGRGAMSWLFSKKLFLWLGNMSFECYMIHQIIITCYWHFKIPAYTVVVNAFSWLLLLLLTVFSAWLLKRGESQRMEKKAEQRGDYHVCRGVWIALVWTVIAVIASWVLWIRAPDAWACSPRGGFLMFRFEKGQEAVLNKLSRMRLHFVTEDSPSLTDELSVVLPIKKKDPYGFYSAKMPEGTRRIRLSYFGYNGQAPLTKEPRFQEVFWAGYRLDSDEIRPFYIKSSSMSYPGCWIGKKALSHGMLPWIGLVVLACGISCVFCMCITSKRRTGISHNPAKGKIR